jgi:hypothetical protein
MTRARTPSQRLAMRVRAGEPAEIRAVPDSDAGDEKPHFGWRGVVALLRDDQERGQRQCGDRGGG